MEPWITHIGTAPIATLLFVLCAVILMMARHIIKLQDARIADQKAAFQEVKDLAVATNTALSSASQAMTANGATLTAAREAMQTATALMERSGR